MFLYFYILANEIKTSSIKYMHILLNGSLNWPKNVSTKCVHWYLHVCWQTRVS